jgi:hypothetical protein
VSCHNTILYVDVISELLRHAFFGSATSNLPLEIGGFRGRLTMKRAAHVFEMLLVQPSGEIRIVVGRADIPGSATASAAL